MTEHYYGWIPQLPDQRDRVFTLLTPTPLPPVVDLRPHMPPVYDQGQLGSCTANMIAAAVDYERSRQGLPFITPSRLAIYYWERSLEHTTHSDAGATIRDAYKVVNSKGAPPETDWPYDVSKFAHAPPAKATADAKKDRVVQYEAVPQTLTTMQQVLASELAIGVGISVYESFESPQVAQSGIVPLPHPGEQLLGGHAVLVVGYDAPRGAWIVRNSWGTGWGQAGYFNLPFSYLTNPNLAGDFWACQLVQAS